MAGGALSLLTACAHGGSEMSIPTSFEEAAIQSGAQILETASVCAPSINTVMTIKSISSLTFFSWVEKVTEVMWSYIHILKNVLGFNAGTFILM